MRVVWEREWTDITSPPGNGRRVEIEVEVGNPKAKAKAKAKKNNHRPMIGRVDPLFVDIQWIAFKDLGCEFR